MIAWRKAAWSLVLVLFLALSFGVRRASAQSNPCGKFDFSNGISSCKIEVSGGCSAKCTPLKFEAACSGGCTSTSDTMCVDTCGTQCVAMCDPALLDCFAGCHAECDAPTSAECQQKHPTDGSCSATATAQCDVHCKDACQVPSTNCSEHCNKCCTGSCTTQVNFDCDFSCFADVKGGCDVQCQRPQGAIFCNDQYVYASDVEACIKYLATQGLTVDVSARASASAKVDAGCSVVPRPLGTNAGSWLSLSLLTLPIAARRRRRAAKRTSALR